MRPQLRVYWPDDAATDDAGDMIIPLPKFRSRSVGRMSEIRSSSLQRARLLFANRDCPACHASQVEPIELADGKVDRFRHLIPGTSTIVGFHCEHCRHEWSVSAREESAAEVRSFYP